ncbi:MAG: hypothetical protein IKE30_09705 [Clostridia bacterium]|nr:hypothetical protein [Clostridia bacterium]
MKKPLYMRPVFLPFLFVMLASTVAIFFALRMTAGDLAYFAVIPGAVTLVLTGSWVWLDERGVHACMFFVSRYFIAWKDLKCCGLLTVNGSKPFFVFSKYERVWNAARIPTDGTPTKEAIVLRHSASLEKLVRRLSPVPIETRKSFSASGKTF